MSMKKTAMIVNMGINTPSADYFRIASAMMDSEALFIFFILYCNYTDSSYLALSSRSVLF